MVQPKEEVIQRQIGLRKHWINNGMEWWQNSFRDNTTEEAVGMSDDRKPKDWSPLQQLKNIPKEFLAEGEHY